ncbi:MAG: hypothetical protein R3D55_09395 [Chloroflexota bacterium]
MNIWDLGIGFALGTAVLLMRDWPKTEDEKPHLPESIWASEEIMMAPGFGKTAAPKRLVKNR